MRRLWGFALHRSVMKEADRLAASHGAEALDMARHAVMAARERSRADAWSRVLHEIELRSGYRPW